MKDIVLISENTLEIEFNMRSSVEEEDFERLLGNRVLHPKIGFVRKLMEENPLMKISKYGDSWLSEDIVISMKINEAVKDNVFLESVNKYLQSKKIPFKTIKGSKRHKIFKVIVENGMVLKAFARFQIEKTEDVVIPDAYKLFDELFDVFDYKDYVFVEKPEIGIERKMSFNARLKFWIETPDNVFSFLNKIKEKSIVEDLYTEYLIIGEDAVEFEICIFLKKEKKDKKWAK